jgi:acetoacetyl-CoA synthetase
MIQEGDLLWTPSAARREKSHVTAFTRWLERERGLRFDSYDALWRWSIQDIEAFWKALWDYFGVRASKPYTKVLGRREMPGAEWFPGAHLNYAEHALAKARSDADALLYMSETTPLTPMSWDEFGNKVRTLATYLRESGVKPGDRVVAVLPNSPYAAIALMATTSIGAIWSCCGPDFGPTGILERFTQLSPKVIFHVDGYVYGGKRFDRQPQMRQILSKLESIEQVICVPYLDRDSRTALAPNTTFWDDIFDRAPVRAEEFQFEQVPFDHPLWILFSSGTTGLPKAIVHGHGGILLEHLKHLHFNYDAHAGDRMFFYTTSGWMIWNFLISSTLGGVVPLLYDGHPAYPTIDSLWKLVDDAKVTLFGTSPTYIAQQQQAGVVPKDKFKFEKLESMTLAGSPVSPECMQWIYENVKQDLHVASGSGGTDCCTGFVGGVSTLPVYAGEIQARALGCAAFAFDDEGREVVDEVGELVLTQPMPSMPLYFWNDPTGERYRDSYFDRYPGVWRHGDFARFNARGGSFVLGRSDATLNRHGVRIGTAEIYRSLQELPEIEDSIIVNLDLPGGKFFMPLFVKLRPGVQLDDALRDRIRTRLRTDYSPRHVPDKIYQVDDIPSTLTGKKLEVPVRRILMGVPPDKAANRSALANPDALDFFVAYAKAQKDYSLT